VRHPVTSAFSYGAPRNPAAHSSLGQANDWNPTGGSPAVAAFTSPFGWTTAGDKALASAGETKQATIEAAAPMCKLLCGPRVTGRSPACAGKAIEQIGAEWPDGTGDDRGWGKSRAQDLWDNWQDVK
jgi:hypothetical protein